MTNKEKLLELIGQVQDEGRDYSDCFYYGDKPAIINNDVLVDHLINNGVTINSWDYEQILLMVLKSKIGEKIYWASKNWRNYEVYTIKDVRLEVQKGDFFGKKYQGKECIKIFLEDGGYYIANNIGKTLFFSEEEAKAHTDKK